MVIMYYIVVMNGNPYAPIQALFLPLQDYRPNILPWIVNTVEFFLSRCALEWFSQTATGKLKSTIHGG